LEIREHRDRQQRGAQGDDLQRSKQSLKGSRVSFERRETGNSNTNNNTNSNTKPAESSDEDSFEEKRSGFQQQKATSVDHKGILKDLKHILANDNRRQTVFHQNTKKIFWRCHFL